MYRRLIVQASIAAVLVLLLNALAVSFYWYVSMPWFDMFMHALGGLMVALLGGALLWRQLRTLPLREMIIVLMLFVFIVGLGWEYYEYIVQTYIKSVRLANIPDSFSDIICDMVGGLLGTYLVILTKRRYNKNNGITTFA